MIAFLIAGCLIGGAVASGFGWYRGVELWQVYAVAGAAVAMGVFVVSEGVFLRGDSTGEPLAPGTTEVVCAPSVVVIDGDGNRLCTMLNYGSTLTLDPTTPPDPTEDTAPRTPPERTTMLVTPEPSAT